MGHQLSFLSSLSPDEPLLPYVVLRSDERWSTALQELNTAGWVSLDTEFWQDSDLLRAAKLSGRDLPKAPDWDPWSCRLRLLQIGLPSGLVIVADFGLKKLPINARWDESTPNADLLAILQRVLRSYDVPVFGQALGTEALILRRHFGLSIRRPRDTMLASQVIWAGVGSKEWVWTDHGRVKRDRMRHTLQAIGARVGIEFDKTEQSSDWSSPKLSNRQINYAAKDVHRDTLVETWSRLAKLAKRDGVWESVLIECDAAPAFWEIEWRGMSFDQAATQKLADDYGRVADQCFAQLASVLPSDTILEGPGSAASLPLALTKYINPEGDVTWWRKGAEVAALSSMSTNQAWAKGYSEERVCFYRWEQTIQKRKTVREGWLLTPEEAEQQRFKLVPQTGEAELSPFDTDLAVVALLEARSARSVEGVLRKRIKNSWPDPEMSARVAARCRYWQISGGEDDAGAGMGRSSSSKPFNAQNLTAWPLGEKRHKELKLPNARSTARPPIGRGMGVGDFSQAHLRFATEMSQDAGMLEDFNAGRDAHIRLACEIAKAQGVEADFYEWCRIYQSGDKAHPVFGTIKEKRQPAKVGNYTCVCLGGVATMATSAATAVEPIHLPDEIWELTRKAWRETNHELYAFIKGQVKKADRSNHEFGEYGVYGEVWNCTHNRRLFLLKEWNIPQWEDAVGRWSVRGTDTSAAMWQMSEANALKIALALFLKDCDDHPEWEAFPINAVHDEIDFEFKWNIQYEAEVAWSVYDAMGEGMRRAGIKSLPVRAPDDTPQKLLVQSWADK